MSHERFRTVLLVAAFAGSAAAFPFLPGSLPRAFGVPPGPDAWVSRALSAFLLPLVAFGCCTLLRRLAAADPARENYRRFQPTFELVLDVVVGSIVALHAMLLATLLVGPEPWLGKLPPLLVGAAIAVVGNALPRVRPNAVVGITTPWAQGSEAAWASAHRVGGYVLVGFGLLIVVATFVLRNGLGWLVGAGMAAVVVVLAAVSWLTWRREGATCDHVSTGGRSS